MAKIFTNPQNGYQEEACRAFDWLWCFLFLPIFLASYGAWRHVFISSVIIGSAYSTFWPLGIVVHLITNLVYAAMISEVIEVNYLRQGWHEEAPSQPSST